MQIAYNHIMAFMNFVHASMSFPDAVVVQVSTHQTPFRDSRYIISEIFVQSKDEGQILSLPAQRARLSRGQRPKSSKQLFATSLREAVVKEYGSGLFQRLGDFLAR